MLQPGKYVYTRTVEGQIKSSVVEIFSDASGKLWWKWHGESMCYECTDACVGKESDYTAVIEPWMAAEGPTSVIDDDAIESLISPPPGLMRRADCTPSEEFLAGVLGETSPGLVRKDDGDHLKWREIVALTTYARSQRTRHSELGDQGVTAFNALRKIYNEVQCELRIPETRTDLLATMEKLRLFITDDEP